MSVNEIATSPTTTPQPAAALPTCDDPLPIAAATISKDSITGLWKVDQNPLDIPMDFNGEIQWTIVSPGGLFPLHAPILFDFGSQLPDPPPLVPALDRLSCSMPWSNPETPNIVHPPFTYYAFVQEGEDGPVFRVDPTVQNQPPG
ncbi:MAG: hypothetical protein QOJ98_2127 [Acidobacteriota bacterium]|jgi:hypothetical protein|nr:hypothetical protein [Acidobacteriota bacterium]